MRKPTAAQRKLGLTTKMEVNLIENRIDNVLHILRECDTDWSINYWTTVYQYLLRELKRVDIK